jgi:hypothetical protein
VNYREMWVGLPKPGTDSRCEFRKLSRPVVPRKAPGRWPLTKNRLTGVNHDGKRASWS